VLPCVKDPERRGRGILNLQAVVVFSCAAVAGGAAQS
jgi:hypothetical protein